jgi:hypothetical protein
VAGVQQTFFELPVVVLTKCITTLSTSENMAPIRPPAKLSDQSLSSLKTFVDSQGEEGPTLKVSCKDFRNAFNAWRTGKPVSHGLSKAMRGLGYAKRRLQHGADDKPTEVYFGIQISDAVTDAVKECGDLKEFDGFGIRRTNGPQPLVSIIDLISATTGVTETSDPEWRQTGGAKCQSINSLERGRRRPQ